LGDGLGGLEGAEKGGNEDAIDFFRREALGQFLSLNFPIGGKVGIVGLGGGVEPIGVHKINAVAMAGNPKGLGHGGGK